MLDKQERQLYVNVKIEALSCVRCCDGKTITITYSEPVYVALVIQHAKLMRLFILSVACPPLPYFTALSYKRRDLRGRGGGALTIKLCFDFLYKFCLKQFSS